MSLEFRGYYRFPTIHRDKLAFVAEDDLWLVSAEGGTARRLTANLGAVVYPLFSPDGEWLAFVGSEEGHPEVYVMAASGGPARRLTFLGGNTVVVGWRDERIVFASTAGQPFRHDFWLYEADLDGNEPQKLPLGVASAVSWGPNGVVIGRNTGDPARWKRYRGGTAGELWVDEAGTGQFRKLIALAGNLANPMWIGQRIYFLSDHEGVGNVYSCTPAGEDLQKHTHHADFYARNASSDGQRIVYHAGADIHVFDPATSQAHQVEIEYHSPQVQRSRKFVEPAKYLEDFALSHDGAHLALVSRGQTCTMGNWEGPVLQHGIRNGVRYRLTRFLNDGKRLILTSDEGGVDHLELHAVDGSAPPRKYLDLDVGRPQHIKVSPARDEIALTNHRHELVRVDLESGDAVVIERSKRGPIAGFNWSPDGRWIAYAHAPSPRVRVIKLYDRDSDQSHEVTEPLLQDFAPVFDPGGKYLFFLSTRVFDPVYDNLHFDLNFPRGVRPYAITLRKDLPSPFVPEPRGLEKSKNATATAPAGTGEPEQDAAEEEGQGSDEAVTGVTIDLDGIADRIVAFPVGESIYGAIDAVKGRVFYTVYPIQGARDRKWFDPEPPARASLRMFDLETLEESVFVDRVTSFTLSGDGTAMACRIGKRLRVIRATRDPSQALSSEEEPGRKSGWIDLSRPRISVEPSSEWQQMFHEAWRLQRDYFWVEDMSGVDWEKVLRRYESLVGRVASRSEFSDLLWEVQGELGTSHCYELGGDYRPQPQYKLGFLGVDLAYEPDHDAYRFRRILKGDVWDEKFASPLRRPGVNLEEGMLLLAIGGQRLSRDRLPSELLVNQAGQEVQLTIADSDGGSPRTVCVKAAGEDVPIRYRDWVEANRKYVHEKSGGRVGYIHVPDMGPDGFAEFHRYFLMELDHSGLIVDVRYNGGGHVSALLLEKLARQRLGYDLSRWMGPVPYPEESVGGPVVALTNEQAGSDGDIFSHAFKLMNLGKLIGRRTWGGVIGIWPRNWLVDGTLTTQPEFSFWFKDVGWGVENYGTDPDVEVDITPQDYVQGIDAQLDRAIAEALQAIEENPPLKPDFDHRPRRTLPA